MSMHLLLLFFIITSSFIELKYLNKCLRTSVKYNLPLWEKFEGQVPKDAVRIKKNVEMLVCRNMEKKCVLGILKGSKCEYEEGEEGKLDHPDSFEVLVNKDDFESLEWKREAKSLPAVKSAKRKQLEKIFSIQKTKTKDMKKLESKTGRSKVLTVSYENVMEHEISDYVEEEKKTKEIEISKKKDKKEFINREKDEVPKTITSTIKTKSEERWDLTYSITTGEKLMFKGGPKSFKAGLESSLHFTATKHKENSFVEEEGLEASINAKVPPKSKCTFDLVIRKIRVEIPFNATLIHRFNRGEPKRKLIMFYLLERLKLRGKFVNL
uniref:Uncharacterized protein n=1 Tax=Oryzias sinensis TaxID=183150 RepID=A0A8C7Y9U3_9TELE